MLRYPIYKQDNNYSCGAYCIKMILKYHHLNVEIKEIKQRSRLTNEGISVYGMIKCLEDYNFDAKAYQSDLETVLKEAKLPCILHVINGELTHYIVLYKITKNYLLIGDPEQGLVKRKFAEIEPVFTGICICINHVGRYYYKNEEVDFKQFLWHHLQNNYRFLIRLLSKAIVLSGLSILGSFYFQGIVDLVEKMNYHEIVIFTLVFMGIMTLRIAVSYQRKQLEISIQRYLNNEYVNKTVVNMLYLPFSYYLNNQEGVLLTKVQNLFALSNFFIHFYMAVFMDSILIVGVIIALCLFSFPIALLVIVVLSIMSFLVLHRLKGLNQANKKIIGAQEEMNQGYLEYLKNIYNTHQFSLKTFAKEKVNYLFDEYNYHVYYHDNYINLLNRDSELLIQGVAFMVVLLASFYYKQDLISIGDIVLLYMLTTYLIEPLFNVIAFILEKDEVGILYERYKEIVPSQKTKKKRLKGPIKKIVFDHITYSYGYQLPIIEHLSLTIDHSIWLKGDTGAGKSTLLKLLMKQDEIVKGNIYINGQNLGEIDQNSLYQKIVYLDKEPIFYHESLRFNLLLNRNNEQLLFQLFRKFDLYEFQNRLEMMMEIDGQPLSSGQRQIMMLIRVLLRPVEVLILDEAICNVDETRFRKIIDYLRIERPEIMVIIVSHQTKIVKELFDCVIIKKGKIDK